MDIYIMGNKIDYTIDKERTIKDIVENIAEIVSSYGHSITELRIDGKPFSVDDPLLESIEIKTVSNLEVDTASYFEISTSLLHSLVPYTQNLRKHINEGNIDFETFDQARSWVIEVLITSINILFTFSPRSEYVLRRNEIVDFISNFTYNELQNNTRKSEFMKKLDELEIFLNDITKVLDRISQEGNLFFDTTIDNDLSNILRLIDDIPLKLQTGNDEEALKGIYEFSEIFINLIEFLRYVIRSSGSKLFSDYLQSFDFSKFDSINSIIESIIDSVQKRDFVSASDLISYELKPLVEELNNFIANMRDKALKQISEN